MITIDKNRDIPSVQKLPWDTICNTLTSLQVSLETSMIQRCYTALYQRANKSASKWLLKSYVFIPTLSAQEKNYNKNLSSARVMWYVYL